MEAFATVEDLEARWRTLTDAEAAKAETLLMDASVTLENIIRRKKPDFDWYDDYLTYQLKVIVCSMVRRVMVQSDEMIDATSHTQTAGSYSETISFSDPAGDGYPKTRELKDLGLLDQRVYTIRPLIHRGECCDCW